MNKSQYLAHLSETALEAIRPQVGDLSCITLGHVDAMALALRAWLRDKHPEYSISARDIAAALARYARAYPTAPKAAK